LQRPDRGPALLEVSHAGEHVDDRLGGEAGNARAADVVDACGEPRRQHGFEALALRFERGGPCGVVGDDAD